MARVDILEVCGAPPGSELRRFPPFTSPLGRVAQTLAALWFASYFFFWLAGLGFGVALWKLGVVSANTLAACFVLYIVQIGVYKPHLNRGWPNKFLYSPLPDLVLHYYNGTCVREGPAPDPKGRYMFAVFPHAVYATCRAFSGGAANWNTLYPGISARWASFSAAFVLPGIREFSLLCGCVDATGSVLQRLITVHGENIILLPGGIDEMTLTDGSNDTKLVSRDRKGYVKLAISHGMDIIPSFCFGEKRIHRAFNLPGAARRWLYNNARISGTFCIGRYGTFLGFKDAPLSYVSGQPIRVKQQNPVTPEYLDEVHAQVEASILDIFTRYKKTFGYADDETLTFVSVAEARAFGKEQREKSQ